jgi:nucleoid-associated protein YgaU
MGDSTSRVFAALALVIAVWVVVYWLYEPTALRRVIVDDRPSATGATPVTPVLPQPRSLPPVPQPQPEPTTPEPAFQDQPETLAPGPDEVLSPPEFDDYTIQTGDTLETIAQRRYGDRGRWRVIARANPLLTPHKLKPGRTVFGLPRDPDNIQGRLVKIERPAAVQQAPEVDPPITAVPTAPGGWRTYTVQENDTLWGIAKKMYGRPALTGLIADANSDVLPDPDRLRAGITLKIPPAPPAD